MKAIPRLPLNALRTFEAVARLGSMARAAEALNVQPSAVSMQIKNLSEFVGLPLLVRKGRKLELTPGGQELLASVTDGLGQIADTIAGLKRTTRDQPFTISVLPAFLHLWLLPRLARFEAAHPGFRMRVLASRALVDPSRGDVDAAIRLGAGSWRGLKAEKLMDEGLVPVCSPGLRKQVGALKLGDLPRNVPLLQSAVDPWIRWSPQADQGQQRSVAVHDAMAVVQAAQQGLGIALARTTLVHDAIVRGKLVAVGEPINYGCSYYWVTSLSRAMDERHSLVLNWLLAEIASSAIPTLRCSGTSETKMDQGGAH